MEGTDIYLDTLVKVADADAVTAANMTLTLDYDGAGQTYKESTYTFDLSSVELNPNTEDVKVLVAYFSATNNTEGVAKKIANGIKADLYEIVPEVPYTSADLNYNNSDSRANKEMNDPSCRPAISGSVENMEQYDIVFIGYPIWWGQAPKIIYTFMESYDFSGKTIVPFCTSASSGVGSSATNLQPLANNAVWIPGKRFSGGASQNTIMEWVKSLGLNLGE
ncbi:MAG: flavodoxin [Lachnospiraceae bacterium]|nr:flavodoxin [Lachnospiraceae bacterium]